MNNLKLLIFLSMIYGCNHNPLAMGENFSTFESAKKPATPFEKAYVYSDARSGDYVYDSSVLEFNGQSLSLISPTEKETQFTTGQSLGLGYDQSSGSLLMSSSTGCDASTTNCLELHQSWTPKWNEITAYWKLNGQGTIADGDIVPATVGPSGQARVGTGLSYTDAKFSQGVFFNSNAANNISVPDSPSVQFTDKFSVSFWCRRTGSTAPWDVYVAKEHWNAGAGWLIFNDSTLGRLQYYQANGASIQSPEGALPNDRWSHVVVSNDNGFASMYINGEFITSGTVPITNTSLDLLIGARHSNDGPNVTDANQGSIDEMAIWKAALSASDVKTIYQHQKSHFAGSYTSKVYHGRVSNRWGNLNWEALSAYSSADETLTEDLAGLWHFDEAAGTSGAQSVVDSSGRAQHGTPSNVTFGVDGKISSAAGLTNSNINLGPVVLTDDLTLSLWVKPGATQVESSTLISSHGQAFGGITLEQWSTSTNRYFLAWGNGTNYEYCSDASKTILLEANEWQHVLITKTGAQISYRLNGQVVANCTAGDPTIADSGLNLLVGGFAANSAARRFNGQIDELSIWSRALSEAEATRLYQTGATRIRFQVRACNSSTCATEAWFGPDGTNKTFFEKAGVNFEDYTLPNLSKTYFQFKAILERDEDALLALGPSLGSVSVGSNSFTTDHPGAYQKVGTSFTALFSLSEVLGSGGCQKGVRYTLSKDAVTWYYWSGMIMGWEESDGTPTELSSVQELNSGLPSFASELGDGSLYLRAHLGSDGPSACALSSLTISGQL